MSETDRGNVAATGGGQAGTGTAKDAPARSAGVEPEFWARYRYAEGPLRAWFAVVAKARWANPTEIKQQFGSIVDFVGDNRVIFDLGG